MNQQELVTQRNAENVTYFGSLGVEHIPKEIRKFIREKVQAYNSVMCGYFCIGFINFMLKSKSLLEYTNLFSSKNDKIILKCFQ